MTKTLKDKDVKVRVMLGTWIGGSCLSHLKLITPADAKDIDVTIIVSEIKAAYRDGISRGESITLDQKGALIAKLEKCGYDRQELIDMVDEARGRSTDYTLSVAKLLDQKRVRELSLIDWSKKGAEQQAKDIIETYTIEGATELKQPAVNPASTLIEQCMKISEMPTVPAGTPELTRITGGFKPGQLVVITAGTSVGKTAYSLQTAEQAAKEGKKVLYFTIEVSAARMCGRLIARETDGAITNKEIDRITRLSGPQLDMIAKAETEINKLTSENLLLIENERQLTAIKRQIELHKPDVVVVDQISLVEDSTYQADSVRLSYKHLIEEFKFTAMDQDCVMIVVAQINRTGIASKDPRMHHLQESAALEQTADVVLILRLEDEEQKNDLSRKDLDMIIRVDKFRDGQAGYELKCTYNRRAQMFEDEESEAMFRAAEAYAYDSVEVASEPVQDYEELNEDQFR